MTDDELLLFDMMFDGSASPEQLSSNVYPSHMNCVYNHSLSDAELDEVIDSLLARRLIQLVGSTLALARPRYTLTDRGGKLWESERRPNWSRYVATTQRELGIFPTGSILAFCTDESIGRRCLGAMFASGLITPAGSIRRRIVGDKRLVPWKTFPLLFALRCRTCDSVHNQPRPVEWDVYESSRCWWRTIAEMQRFSQ